MIDGSVEAWCVCGPSRIGLSRRDLRRSHGSSRVPIRSLNGPRLAPMALIAVSAAPLWSSCTTS